MRRFLGGLLILALVGLTNCAATPLTAKWTMPTDDASGPCAGPQIYGPIFAPEGLSAIVYWQRSTDSAPRDSVRFDGLTPGQAMDVVLTPDIGPGIWTKWAYVEKSVQGRVYRSCISNTDRDTISAPAREVRDMR